MKIIDDPKYFSVQNKWFNTQILAGENSSNWIDFRGAKLSIMALSERAFHQGEWDEVDLNDLRAFLNETGLRKINNAISAFKKRERKSEGRRSVQIQLTNKIADKFKSMAESQGMTMSGMLEQLISGEVQMDLFRK